MVTSPSGRAVGALPDDINRLCMLPGALLAADASHLRNLATIVRMRVMMWCGGVGACDGTARVS